MDAAGQNATRRALEIAGAVGLKLRVALVGEGKDPDEFVNLHGGEAYLEAVAQAQPALDYLFGALQRQYDASTLDGQHHILDEMFAVLLAQQDTFQFNSFIRKMAMTLHMDEGMIRSEALSFAKRIIRPYIFPRKHHWKHRRQTMGRRQRSRSSWKKGFSSTASAIICFLRAGSYSKLSFHLAFPSETL